MQKFEGISFLWALVIIAAIALVFGVRAWIEYKQVARDAESDFDFKSGQGMTVAGLSKDKYVKAYRRYYNPRGKAYVSGAMTAVLVLTLPALWLIDGFVHLIWNLTGKSDIYAPNFMVAQFITFFSIITIWVLIIFVVMREFHRRAPISFKNELSRMAGDDGP